MTSRIRMDDVIAARLWWEGESEALDEAHGWREFSRQILATTATIYAYATGEAKAEADALLHAQVELRELLMVVCDELEPRARLALRDYERIRKAYERQQARGGIHVGG